MFDNDFGRARPAPSGPSPEQLAEAEAFLPSIFPPVAHPDLHDHAHAYHRSLVLLMLEADPSPDRRYMPALRRWKNRLVRGFTPQDIVDGLALHYKFYPDAQPVSTDAPQPPLPRFGKATPHRARDLLGPDILRGWRRAEELFAAMKLENIRRPHASFIQKGGAKKRDSKWLGKGAECLLHLDGARLYRLESPSRPTYDNKGNYVPPKDGKAMENYIKGTELDDYRSFFLLEQDNGQRHAIMPDGLSCYDENYYPVSVTRLFATFPALAEHFRPDVLRLAQNRDEHTFDMLRRVHGLAQAFPQWNLPPTDRLIADAFLAGIRKTKETADHDGSSHAYWGAADSVRFLAAFPDAARHVPGDAIREHLTETIRHRVWGEAVKILSSAANLPQWSASISAADIAPLFPGLAKATRYAGRTEMLADLFGLVALRPGWRTGAEARFLPDVIDHLANDKRKTGFRNAHRGQTPDPAWQKIATLLIAASKYKPWHDELAPRLPHMNVIKPSNIRAAFGIDELLGRFTEGEQPRLFGAYREDWRVARRPLNMSRRAMRAKLEQA